MRFERLHHVTEGQSAGYRYDAFHARGETDQVAAWDQLAADCAHWREEQLRDPILDFVPPSRPERRLRKAPAPSAKGAASAPVAAKELRDLDLVDVYERLTGEEVGSTRKVRCLWHTPDRTPSMHVYADHVHCFGCGASGTVIDVAAVVYDLSTRGRDFIEILSRLATEFLGRAAA